jgi:L-seryl-tRNA(Ser) seleniumtransferase
MGRSADAPAALSRLPSIQEIDRHLAATGLPHGKAVRARVETVLDGFRERLRRGPIAAEAVPSREDMLHAVEAALRLPEPNRLRRVINATGVVVHTNLGRAVLSRSAGEEALALLQSYTNLEFDLDSGRRGERAGRVPELLAQLSGAESGLAVNNNAAAVLLLLSALASGGEVIVSRGELVEIGGGFRVPEIMAQSGARLIEVGTTNRTRISDYADAINERTRAVLKVHRSNFAMSGFVEEVPMPELAALAREHGIAAWHDLGSGTFYRFTQPALAHVPTVAQHVREGADVITFSGDKLLGSVQAGLVAGRSEPIARMARHPLFRSLRMDKARLILLERSLVDLLEPGGLRARNPTIDFLERTVEEMEPMAREVTRALDSGDQGPLRWSLVEERSLAGGGALPDVSINTLCIALERPGEDGEALARALRGNDPPIICRVHERRVLLDLRTVFSHDLPAIAGALKSLSRFPRD